MLGQLKRSAAHAARSFRDDWRQWAGAPEPALAARLLDAVAALGVAAGDSVLLQVGRLTPPRPLSQRLRDLGQPSFDAVFVDGICRLIGAQGLLAMPCQSVRDPKRLSVQERRYDFRRERLRGLVGYFMRQPNVVRSASPILPLAALGAGAPEIMAGHLDAAPYPMGRNSPWHKLLGRGTKTVLIGETANLSLLMPANMDHDLYARPSFFNKPFPFSVTDEAGASRSLELHLHALPFQARYDLASYADFAAYMAYLTQQHDVYRSTTVQGVEVTVFSLDKQFEAQRNEAAGNVYLEDARYW